MFLFKNKYTGCVFTGIYENIRYINLARYLIVPFANTELNNLHFYNSVFCIYLAIIRNENTSKNLEKLFRCACYPAFW